MGLSAYPTPAGFGILCMFLFGAADLIFILRNFIFCTLQVVGIKILEEGVAEGDQQEQELQDYSISDTSNSSQSCSKAFSDSEISFKKMKYLSLKSNRHKAEECSICLTEFEAISVINQLSCGHFFHSHCLGTWLGYLFRTCPLCRTKIALQEQEKCTSST